LFFTAAPSPIMSLPSPSPEALAHSAQLTDHIRQQIAAAGGWISFARYMELALYAPGLGYYSAGSRKFGAAGDFITAPEMTPRFAQTLARQVQEILAQTQPQVIEVGAGSGRLAADLLLALGSAGVAPERYGILELSGELAARQRETIARLAPQWLDRVEWLSALPDRFSGVVIGNEVLDAMPAHLVVWHEGKILERGVEIAPDVETGAFRHADRPATGALLSLAEEIVAASPANLGRGSPYLSEISLANRAWTAEWAKRLDAGALLLIDYGFPRHEYYHPQRSSGTLMCHYRHHAHGEPFYLPGLQDITVHVDFTAIAEAGFGAGISVLGYAAQSHFLLNCGILDLMGHGGSEASERLRDSNAVQKLLSPAEMGELFKVIALGRGVREPLLGFTHGDRLAAL
jgi:SAM-dependent MidA family methyltransferase